MNYYATLELSTQASSEDIRRAYRRLVLGTHPDRTPDPAQHRRYLAINEAYETLSDPTRRAAYDVGLAPPLRAQPAPVATRPRRPPPLERRRGRLRTVLVLQHFNYVPYAGPARRLCQWLLVLPLLILLDFSGPQRTVAATFDTVGEQRNADGLLRYHISTSHGQFVTSTDVPLNVPAFWLRTSWLFRVVHEARLPNGQTLLLEQEMGGLEFFAGLLAVLAGAAQWKRLSAAAVVNLSIVANMVGLIVLLMALSV